MIPDNIQQLRVQAGLPAQPPAQPTAGASDIFTQRKAALAGTTSSSSSQPQGGKDWLQKTGDVVNSIFPGKQLGNAVGTSINGVTQAIKQHSTQPLIEAGQENAQNFGKVAGDVGQIGLTMAAPFVGTGPTVGGRILANTALGAGLGGTNAISEGKNAGDVAKSTAIGGVIGGGISALGEGAKYITENLPKWLTKMALPKLDSKNLDYAGANTKIGSITSLKSNSNKAIGTYEDSIQSVLSHPEHMSAPEYTPASLLGQTLEKFPNSNYTPDSLISNAQDIAPKVSKLIGKFENGQANLQEINTIRKELDVATQSVYTSLNRPPESKMLGAALSNTLRDFVKTNAPETVPIFEKYSKEVGLNKALSAAVKKGESKIDLGNLKDIAAGATGWATGGWSGALEAILAERVLMNPAAQLAGAKVIQGASKFAVPAAETAFQGLKAPIIKGMTNK